MQKFRINNITVFLLEDYEVNVDTTLVETAIKHVRETNKESMFFECLNDDRHMAKEFFDCGYTVDEVNNKNLHISHVKTSEELINKMDFTIMSKGTKNIYFNFPDTIVDDIQGVPDEYDFISVIMYLMVMNKGVDLEKYKQVHFYLTVQRSALKTLELFGLPIK